METLLLGLAFFLSFIFACHQAFRPLKRALQLDLPLSAITPRYHRLQTQLSILALFVLAGDIYVLNIKFHLRGFPGFDESLTLSGFIGLGLYLLHLCVIWTLSYPFHKRIHRSQISRAAFLKGHLSFASALLIPWVLISLLSDVMELLSLPAFFDTSAGQFVLLAGTLIVFVLFAPWLVVRLWWAQPMPTTPAREELETFCREHRFKVGGFMFWPLLGGEILTAGVMGILPKLRYIMITKGLLALLDMEEIKAVVAHEMGRPGCPEHLLDDQETAPVLLNPGDYTDCRVAPIHPRIGRQ